MVFRIADTFTESLAKLQGDEQKAVKTTAFDLQMDPANPGNRIDAETSPEEIGVFVRSEAELPRAMPAISAANLTAVTDDAGLREVCNTERHLLYVACTRARDHLLITGVDPVSEFLDDMHA